ncbi:outer membrane beta-barrel protein [Legionella worsleiensis]|uniref:Outer membrane protein beta-barrel domain-containing protein n=1 Tax=Legionella worsleiensis TaxID=45076 RepID=A0A0W1ALJ2_9GAMM|nr:outer membrane beta-barrel protein [Legionella worsleiensis]KTD82146.1 hypothetical protein Lwor_0066 [Legionella worsleiensis]STY31378.1 Uncharacterised protein [Legionella worsleiensis]
MKHFIPLGLISNLLISSSAFAVNPQQGFYFGLLGEISTGPATHEIAFVEPSDPTVWVGRVNNTRVGGGGGMMLGYRYHQFRVEGEFLYNWNGSGSVDIDDCTLLSPVVQTPTGICPQDHFQANSLGFNGSVATMYGLANIYWDFIDYESNNTGVFPYAGLGIGYARVTSRGNFTRNYYTLDVSSNGSSRSFTSEAAQGIVGVGLFMDDFTWAGMDYRYLTTNTLKDYGNKRYAINSLNFTITSSFDRSSG